MWSIICSFVVSINNEMNKKLKERYKYTKVEELVAVFDKGEVCAVDVRSDMQKCLSDSALLDNTVFVSEGCVDVQDPIVAHNLANVGRHVGGVGIRVSRGSVADGVVEVDFRLGGAVSGTMGGSFVGVVRNVLEVEAGARVRLVLSFHGDEGVQVKAASMSSSMSSAGSSGVIHGINALTVVRAGQGSVVELVEVGAMGGSGVLMSSVVVEQQADSQVTVTTVDLNNRELVRNQYVSFHGRGAHCSLSGLYLTSDDQRCDNFIKVCHLVPDCTSVQNYKGVMAGSSVASFTGSIYVKQDAQKTAAYQQNHNILLGDKSRVYTRPQLEIYADDVKCNHGATVGRLDEQAIYYMRQRGIPRQHARRLQIEGFAADVVRLSELGEYQALVQGWVARRLEAM